MIYSVYYLYHRNVVIYVGCTSNLSARLIRHSGNRVYNKHKSVEFSSRKKAYAFETTEINRLKPKHNLAINRKSGRKKLPIGQKAVLVGFYTRRENVDRVGGIKKARIKAKECIESCALGI